ncbi:MAG: diacylglycerol/lipid kinase family protein [Acidimicrobiales bacterium]
MRLLLIVNASASSVTARARVVIQKSLAADHQVTVAETSRRGHATRLAHSAATKGTDVVVVLGGDGTLNEAANGLAATPCALGVLPGGSTNVFARTIGVTNDPIEATGQLLSALGAGPGGVRSVGLGSVNARRFLFHAGIGFDAAVVAQVERRTALKRHLGHAFFSYTALETWARRFDRRQPHFSVELHRGGGKEPVGVDDGYFAIILNTDPYTFLGERAFNLVPGTSLDTPLSAVVFRSVGAATLLAVAAAALVRDGGIGRHRKVAVVRDVTGGLVLSRASGTGAGTVLSTAAAGVPYQADGDYLGTVNRCELRWEPDALRLVVPS